MPGVIAINPDVFEDKRDALGVAWNEALRLTMEDVKFVPEFEVTEDQTKFFARTAYSQDALALKRTIVSRIATHDTSISPTPEQEAETTRLLDLILEMPGVSANDRQVVTKMRESVAAGNARGKTRPAPEAREEAGEEGVTEAPAPEPETPETGAAPAGGPVGDVQSAALGGDIRPVDPNTLPAAADALAGAGLTGLGLAPDVKIEAPAAPVVTAPRKYTREEAIREAVWGALNSERSVAKVGDQGRAVGTLQIWKIQVDQANKVAEEQNLPVRFTYEDRKNPEKSLQMARIFFGDKYDRGTTDPVALGGMWRNPSPHKEKAPNWYLKKVREGIAVGRGAFDAAGGTVEEKEAAGNAAAGMVDREAKQKPKAPPKADVTVTKKAAASPQQPASP